MNASGNIYTTGTYSDTVDFDPGTGVANLTPVGGQDIFIQKPDRPFPPKSDSVIHS